jgi:hypothetical protein
VTNQNWSLSLEGYWFAGGGVVVGRNPDGRYFLTGKYGYGFGGGFSYDPHGTSPGYKTPGVIGGGGVWGGTGANFSIFSLGTSLDIGANYGTNTSRGGFWQFFLRPSYGWNVAGDIDFSFKAQAAAGAQATITW